MISLVMRHGAIVAMGAVALALLASARSGLAQPVDDTAAASTFGHLADQILAEEAENGPYSPELLVPLTEMSLVYEERGHYALALGVLQRARQVMRANSGLRTLDQAPLIQRSIENEEARGNFAAAWDLEQELLSLVERHPEDLRTVPILRGLGDKRLDMLQRYLGNEVPPQVVLGCYYKRPHLRDGDCHAGSKGVAVQNITMAAWGHYVEAVGVLLRNQQFANPELHELEMRIVRLSYLHGGRDLGRQSLRRLLSYEVVNDESFAAQLRTSLLIADWDFIFGRNKRAVLDRYVELYELARANDVPKEALAELFEPELPVVLPGFLDNPLVSAQSADSIGFIDVAFEITRYGRSRKIEILDATTSIPAKAQADLVRTIAQSYFRPRLRDGELIDRSPIVLRHFLTADAMESEPVKVPTAPLRSPSEEFAQHFGRDRSRRRRAQLVAGRIGDRRRDAGGACRRAARQS